MLFHWIAYAVAVIFTAIYFVDKDEWSMRILIFASIWYGILMR